MAEFFSNNGSTILVCLILAFFIVLAILKIVKNHKNGIHSCQGECGGCPMHANCRKNTNCSDGK